MRLTKKQERVLHKELIDALSLGDKNICYECSYVNDVNNNENGVELIWLDKSFNTLVKEFMKPYKEMPEIDEEFKNEWIEYHNENGKVVPWCWECQYEFGG
jgi:hypothetical protein